MMDMMNGGNGGWWMGGYMWFFSILFWILIIAGVVLVVRWLVDRGSQASAPPTESALEILKKRYARGEIDRETFERMKRDIGGEGQ